MADVLQVGPQSQQATAAAATGAGHVPINYVGTGAPINSFGDALAAVSAWKQAVHEGVGSAGASCDAEVGAVSSAGFAALDQVNETNAAELRGIAT